MPAYEDDAQTGWNVADESKPSDSESVLTFWKRAIGVRKAHDVLVRPHLYYFSAGVVVY